MRAMGTYRTTTDWPNTPVTTLRLLILPLENRPATASAGLPPGRHLRAGETGHDGFRALHRDLNGFDDRAAEVEPDDALLLSEHGCPALPLR
jgi:hypothetical protein